MEVNIVTLDGKQITQEELQQKLTEASGNTSKKIVESATHKGEWHTVGRIRG